MKKSFFACTLVIALSFPFDASAWGVLGHRVTGGIAEYYLNAKTKAQLKKLLGNESLAMVSNWADFIKSDRSFDYLSPWHYINISGGKSRLEVMQYLQGDTGEDLYRKMKFVIGELKSRTLQRDKRIFYLKLLIHLIGDAHQPMHMGRPEDRGGNGIKLYWFGTPTNLHRVWDEQLIEFQQLSYTEHVAAINFVTTSQIDKWIRQPISDWIYESYEIAQKLYSEVKSEEKLTYNYNYNHVSILNQQLLKGGVRLAGILNDIFGK